MIPLLAVEAPILTPYYDVIKWTLIIEFIIVIFVGGISLWFQSLISRRKRSREKRKAILVKNLEEIIQSKGSLELSSLPAGVKNLSTFIEAYQEVDHKTNDPHWQTLKKQLQTDYFSPQGQKNARHHRWTEKLKAARCFSIAPRKEDEEAVLKLLHHKRPIVKYVAAHPAAQIATPKLLDALIEMMDQSTHYLRQPFSDALVKGGENVMHYLEKRLEKETNPYTRVSCIEVLKNRMTLHVVDLIEKDLNSDHLNLKIAAIKALGYIDDLRSSNLLLPLLEDQYWQVRALAARSLGYQTASKAFTPLTKACSDPHWWVRMNAAFALKRLGGEGLKILKNQSPEKDRYAYEMSQYVASIEEDQ